MHTVEPRVHLIAQTRVNYNAARHWLDELGATEYEIPEMCTDTECLTTLAGKRCYMSFEPGLNPNVTQVRKDIVTFLDNILKSRHGSVLEHSTYTFAIENVSRVFTAELNRHRAGWAISEGSMRYIRFTDIPFWMPLSIREEADDIPELAEAKAKTRDVFTRAFSQMEENYRELEDIWSLDSLKSFKEKKKITSMMRRIIGMGVATGGVWTGNLRALRHVMAVRMSAAAEEEIAFVFTLIFEHMRKEEATLFKDFEYTEGGWIPLYWKV